jgi:hypothetical protein
MKAVFRKWPNGEVIALLCGTAVDCNPGNVMSYMHVGQHGEASRDLGSILPLATAEEYKPLQCELSRIYECDVIAVKRLKA